MNIIHKFNILFFVFIILSVLSCKEKDKFFKPPENSKKMTITHLELDSIFLDIETSFSGSLKIVRDKLYFADSKFCWVYEFVVTHNQKHSE